jgi:hypothetical protein
MMAMCRWSIFSSSWTSWPGIKGVSPPGRALPPPGRALLQRWSPELRSEGWHHKVPTTAVAAPAEGGRGPVVRRGGGGRSCSVDHPNCGGRGGTIKRLCRRVERRPEGGRGPVWGLAAALKSRGEPRPTRKGGTIERLHRLSRHLPDGARPSWCGGWCAMNAQPTGWMGRPRYPGPLLEGAWGA